MAKGQPQGRIGGKKLVKDLQECVGRFGGGHTAPPTRSALGSPVIPTRLSRRRILGALDRKTSPFSPTATTAFMTSVIQPPLRPKTGCLSPPLVIKCGCITCVRQKQAQMGRWGGSSNWVCWDEDMGSTHFHPC